jgi:hypothetical protein
MTPPHSPLQNTRISRYKTVKLMILAATGLVAAGCAGPSAGNPRVLGATERIQVVEADLDFLAVVDTGAYRTSIHALEIEIQDPAPRMRDNIGRRIAFLLVNEAGRSRRITSTITDAMPVRTSHGTEWRYVVPLRLRWGDVEKEVQVNLRDRSPMAYKLLVGRDWIRGDFLVDVDRNAVD